MNASAMVVVGVGATSSLARGATPTAFLHRAAMAGMKPSPVSAPDGEPVTVCTVPTLDPKARGVARAATLGRQALDEAMGSMALPPSMRAALFYAVDDFVAADEGAEAAYDLGASFGRASSLAPVAMEDVRRYEGGAAAIGPMLTAAREALERHAIDLALVGAAHSDVHPSRIRRLYEAGRLFGPDNIDGVVPGEGAAFIVLMRAAQAHSLGVPVLLLVDAVATHLETARPDNDHSAFEALGMTAAVREVGATLEAEGGRAGWMLTDAGTERWRHYELSAVMTRTSRLWCAPQWADAPSQRLGALGVASGPMHLVLASVAYPCGFAPHDRGLSLTGSDTTGARTAVLFRGAP
ncbi:MAG: beta-ketoacyl synthase N-terminal-like domain-containing protein [Myxococcota bacterium]